MASTNKTTNYELSQFTETDRPAWLTDYNSDMRKIDSNLKEVSDIAGGASGSISALADRMSTAEGNITTNTNDIAALDARADALEAGAQSQAGTIANIQTEQTAQNLGIEAATELGYNLARPYDSASTYAVGAYVLFQNTLYKCITAIGTGEAFDPTKWLAIKATDEIAAGGYTLPIASASTLGGVKVGDGLSIDGSGVLSASGGATITKLDNNNTSFTPTSALVNNTDHVFDSSAPSSSAYNSTSTSISLALDNNSCKSFYIDYGDFIYLNLFLNITMTDTTLRGKAVGTLTLYTELTFDNHELTDFEWSVGSIEKQSMIDYSEVYFNGWVIAQNPQGGTTNDQFRICSTLYNPATSNSSADGRFSGMILKIYGKKKPITP